MRRAAAALAVLAAAASATLVDPDSPEEAMTTRGGRMHKTSRKYELVMSDEFNVDKREFGPQADPRWSAIDHSDDTYTSAGLGSLVYYNSSYVTTRNGSMEITTDIKQTSWRTFNPYVKRYETVHKAFRSGMVMGFNKFCFRGGVVEISAKLPSAAHTGGLWPALWVFGNLGKATYMKSTNMMWPWSYNQCSKKHVKAQEISACAKALHYEMQAGQGRGATEIDILEVQPGVGGLRDQTGHSVGGIVKPYGSMTLQTAPGITSDRRPEDEFPVDKNDVWYRGMEYAGNTSQNILFYGSELGATEKADPYGRTKEQEYQADGISALHQLGADHFERFHKYRLEWQPGPEGYVKWSVDGKDVFFVGQEMLDPFGSQIPVEPSYMIMNTAVSSSWGMPKTGATCPTGCDCSCYDCSAKCKCAMPPGFCASLPSAMKIDYVRVYQDPLDKDQYLGCDPITYPSGKFIAGHKSRYTGDQEKSDIWKPIKKGGDYCDDDSSCGSGTCVAATVRTKALQMILGRPSSRGTCVCAEGFTGPRCLVPDYTCDQPSCALRETSLGFHSLYVPQSLRVFGTIVVAFGAIVLLAVLADRYRGE